MATEQRLIDLDKIKPMDFPSNEMDGLDVVRYLNTLPTVDAVEVVHGRWEHNEYGLQCSKCACDSLYNGFNHPVKSTFCPNCGAKMDLEV